MINYESGIRQYKVTLGPTLSGLLHHGGNNVSSRGELGRSFDTVKRHLGTALWYFSSGMRIDSVEQINNRVSAGILLEESAWRHAASESGCVELGIKHLLTRYFGRALNGISKYDAYDIQVSKVPHNIPPFQR